VDRSAHEIKEIIMAQLLPDPAIEPTITVDRAAAILGVAVRTVYLAIDRDEMPAIRVGRAVRIPTARFLAAYDLTGKPVPAA
jgi:excisionase family DNA binding protein